MEFLLGIDGGGTKTDLVASTLWGGSLARAHAGASSLSRQNQAVVAAALAHGCGDICTALGSQPENCVAVCAGFASAGSHASEYEPILTALLPRARISVMTDAELALHAAVGEGDGIVVISGTGSIAWGRYAGRTVRAGGAAPGNDPGSGDWIHAQLALAAQSPHAIYQQAGLALAELLLTCARDLAWPTPAAFYHGGILVHIPEVLASLAAAWPHSLAPLPRSPADAALELARGALSR